MLAALGGILAVDADTTLRGLDQASEQIQDRGLTASALAHKGNELARRDGEIDPVKNIGAGIAVERYAHVLQDNAMRLLHIWSDVPLNDCEQFFPPVIPFLVGD